MSPSRMCDRSSALRRRYRPADDDFHLVRDVLLDDLTEVHRGADPVHQGQGVHGVVVLVSASSCRACSAPPEAPRSSSAR